jgi:hypothetical protein
VHIDVILVNDQLDARSLNVFISYYTLRECASSWSLTRNSHMYFTSTPEFVRLTCAHTTTIIPHIVSATGSQSALVISLGSVHWRAWWWLEGVETCSPEAVDCNKNCCVWLSICMSCSTMDRLCCTIVEKKYRDVTVCPFVGRWMKREGSFCATWRARWRLPDWMILLLTGSSSSALLSVSKFRT